MENVWTNGLLTSTITAEGTISYVYDCDAKLDTVQQIDAVSGLSEKADLDYDGTLVTSMTLTGTLNETISSTYNDGDFSLASVTYAGGTESFSYDDDGLTTLSGAFTITRESSPGVPNSSGLPSEISDGFLSVTPTYNAFGEVVSMDTDAGTSDVADFSFTYDAVGRITQKVDTLDGVTRTYDYTYDSGGRLDTVKLDTVLVEDYAYDAQGRRTSDIDGRVYAYDTEDHLTSVTDGSDVTLYTYDVDGFLTKKEIDLGNDSVIDETTTYVYGTGGELISVTLDDGTLIEYVNAPGGQRIAKYVDGVLVEKYLWGGLTRLLAVLNASNVVIERYTPGLVTIGGSDYYIVTDQVGTVRALLDDTGAVVREYTYDSFGNPLTSTGTGPELRLRFAGGLYDADTDLTRFGYRDYDSDIGRWTAKDPIGFAGGDTDVYAYVASDPVNANDPSGLAEILWAEDISRKAKAKELLEKAIADNCMRLLINGRAPEFMPPQAYIYTRTIDFDFWEWEAILRPPHWVPVKHNGNNVYIEPDGTEWYLVGFWQDRDHQPSYLSTENSKLLSIGPFGGIREAVYDKNGRLISSSLRGTANVTPSDVSALGHFLDDYLPHHTLGTMSIEELCKER